MLIQNISNVTQAPQPVRLASDGGHDAVSNVGSPQNTATRQPSSEQLRNAVDNINIAMKQSSRNLEFSVDTTTNRPVVKMLDSETGELIRQYPSEEVLAISRSIDEFQQGLLLKQKA